MIQSCTIISLNHTTIHTSRTHCLCDAAPLQYRSVWSTSACVCISSTRQQSPLPGTMVICCSAVLHSIATHLSSLVINGVSTFTQVVWLLDVGEHSTANTHHPQKLVDIVTGVPNHHKKWPKSKPDSISKAGLPTKHIHSGQFGMEVQTLRSMLIVMLRTTLCGGS